MKGRYSAPTKGYVHGTTRKERRARERAATKGRDLVIYHHAPPCGWYTVTRIVGNGNVPDRLGCRRPGCDGIADRLTDRPTPWPRGVPIEPGWEWYTPDGPTLARYKDAGGPTWDHLAAGGLMLRRRPGRDLGGLETAPPTRHRDITKAPTLDELAETFTSWQADIAASTGRRNGKTTRAAADRRALGGL